MYIEQINSLMSRRANFTVHSIDWVKCLWPTEVAGRFIPDCVALPERSMFPDSSTSDIRTYLVNNNVHKEHNYMYTE